MYIISKKMVVLFVCFQRSVSFFWDIGFSEVKKRRERGVHPIGLLMPIKVTMT